jgi:hypothetical protein
MIADKILKSFYIVELHDGAINTIFNGDFGISKITLGSRDFDTDLMATDAMRCVLKFVALGARVDPETLVEKVEFNPEFFPSLPPIVLTEEAQEMQDALTEHEEELDEELSNVGKTAVVITRKFDPLGDFIESRWTIEAPKFKVEGKIAVNPDAYMKAKSQDKVIEMNTPLKSSLQNNIIMH